MSVSEDQWIGGRPPRSGRRAPVPETARRTARVFASALVAFACLSAPRAQGAPAPDADRRFDSLFEASSKTGGPIPAAAGEGAALPDGHPPVPAAEGSADPHARAGMGSLLPLPGPTPISQVADVKALEGVPVLHEGRLKPMITYARLMLLQFSGRTSYKDMSAMQVMARILFAPETAGDLRIFLINNPEVAEALGVAPEKRRKYTFAQLEKSLPKLQEMAEKANAVPEEKRNIVQKEALRVFGNLVEFVNLTRTFTFALPSPAYAVNLPGTRTELGLKPDRPRYSFWELMVNAQAIAKVLEGIGDRGEAARSPVEKEIVFLSQAMYLNSQTLHPSPFRCFPLPPGMVAAGGLPWVSPAEIVAVPEQLQTFHRELDDWAAAAEAYRAGNGQEFAAKVRDYLGAMENRAYQQLSETHFPLEIAYQKAEPFYWGLVLYWLALIGCFLYFLARKDWIYKGTLGIFLAGYAVHVAGIVARIIIMKRPPVTSLFETFPFVAGVSILAALFIERINRRKPGKGIGLLSASLLGVVLLSIANRYAAEGDTMKMLVAVLNSNFWLSTHVVCVTIGYSACLLAGALGHFWLIRALWPSPRVDARAAGASRKADTDRAGGGTEAARGGIAGMDRSDTAKADRLKEIGKMVYGTLCFGLLFSFIGTVLGGIWADQSWGRFWGWDPKENGALLIVIWCVILLHARHWGYIRAFGMAQGAVFGAIVVSLAWFGVNLLNVGLHSYGFTTGAATKLFSYIGGELAFMIATAVGYRLGWGAKSRAAKAPAPRGQPASQPG